VSYAEDLFFESLRLVLKPSVVVFRNYRPDFLRNPATGFNLELDFYIPCIQVAFEIQGQHHYDSAGQIQRDTLKRELVSRHKVELFELSLLQLHPGGVRKRLLQGSKRTGRFVDLAERVEADWQRVAKKIVAYKQTIQLAYGVNECQISPIMLRRAQAPEKTIPPIPVATYATIVESGERVRILERFKHTVKAKELRSNKVVYIKANRLHQFV
jgi:hypothetical protein